jgi:hypothetical protein
MRIETEMEKNVQKAMRLLCEIMIKGKRQNEII